jgi:phosphoglucomutase
MAYMDEYRKWLELFADDRETVAELSAIADNPAEIEDRFYRPLEFGTAGMRGVIGMGLNRMNVHNVRRVTCALAKIIINHPGGAARGVVIGYDSRHMSPEFARETALTLAACGVKAMLFSSLRPVPVLSFSVRHLGAIAGVEITASHNPSKYNGYKVYWEDGGQLPPPRADEVTAEIEKTSFEEAVKMDEDAAFRAGLLVYPGPEVDDAYIAAVKKLQVNPELAREMGDTLKIVYTPLNGTGNLPVRRVLREIGMKHVFVVPEQELPDGDFPSVRVPNPEDPDAFRLAIGMQKRLKADLCVGTDPDCDRVGVACLTGEGEVRMLSGNQIGCILLDYICSQKKERGELPKNGAAVSSIVSTDMAKAICETFGMTHVEVLTGFKFIAEQIQLFEDTGAHTFLFGFEESYGFLSGTEVRDKDGVNAVMLIAEAASYYKKRGMTLADAADELGKKYGFYGDHVKSVTLAGKDGQAQIDAIMGRLHTEKLETIGASKVLATRDYRKGTRETADGEVTTAGLPESDVLYYELEGGAWVCVRPSGTEPKIKVYINAVSASPETTEALLAGYAGDMDKILAI